MALKKIFQNRNLTLLWAGQMVSQSGDSVYQIGLLWLVLEVTGSSSATGLVAMASYLPAMLLSLFAGVAADRGHRRRIMLMSDGIRFGLVLLIPLLYLFGMLEPFFLGANAFLLAIAATFFNPARDAFITEIVPKEGLIRANSLIQTSWQFALLLGPAIAGGLLHYLGNIHLFVACSFTYLVSFIFIFFIRSGGKVFSVSKSSPSMKEIKDGLVFALRNPVIFPLLLLTAADNMFIMGPAIVGSPVFVKQTLGLGAGAFALIMACHAIGMLLGSGGLFFIGGRFKKGHLLLTGMVLDGITFIPLYFVESLVAAGVIIVIHSLAVPMMTVSRSSLIQELVPVEMTGRIFAMVNLSVVGVTALSSGLAGLALEFIEAPTLFLVIGIGGGLCGVVGWIFAKSLKASP
jgi:DHA3 family macrolide efflux protein-like MFS transporter